MFGVDLPLKDLLRKDVSNRLVMYGAFYDSTDNITFTNNTASEESFDQVFLTGHAVSNYYFFVHSTQKSDMKDMQRKILRSIGKQVKRSTTVGENDDTKLCREIFGALGDPRALIFLFRLLNRHNEEYYTTFNRIYSGKKTPRPKKMQFLKTLRKIQHRPLPAGAHQDRRNVQTPENKKIVDEYKDILIGVSEKRSEPVRARQARLRTLSLRLNIPHNLLTPSMSSSLRACTLSKWKSRITSGTRAPSSKVSSLEPTRSRDTSRPRTSSSS
jgi:uncharacterized protein (TIGR04442 family)